MQRLALLACCLWLEFLQRIACGLLSSSKTSRATIVLVVDGLANWVLNSELKNPSTNTVGFEKLINSGVQSDYLLPEFPTSSRPNQYSIVTGLYPGAHGIIGNYMYDRYRRKYFSNLEMKSDLDLHWWNSTLPIWVSAARQNIKAALFWWPGCEVNFEKTNISALCARPYGGNSSASTDLLKEIPNIIQKVTQEKVSLVLIHYDALQIASRKHGPASGRAKSKIEELSKILYTLQDVLEAYDLFKSVNLLVLSDHGMSPVTLENNLYFLDDYLDDMDMVDVIVDNGSKMLVFPRTGKEYQVYQRLANIPHASLFWKDQLQTRWHLKGAKYLSPIILLCDSGYGVYCRNCREKQFPSFSGTVRDSLFKGDSGYDNAEEEMHGVFLARGPDFRFTDKKHKWIRMVDVYQILCDTVKIKCHQHNGSWDRVSEMLNISCASSMNWILIAFNIFILYIFCLNTVFYDK